MATEKSSFKKKIPNIITLLRIVLAPVLYYLVFLKFQSLDDGFFATSVLAVYILVALLDNLDGFLARKFEAVSNFGKIADPIADKLLFGGLLIVIAVCLNNLVVIIWVFIIIARELFITVFRAVFVKKYEVVIAANVFGKLKTAFQATAIGFFIAPLTILPPFFTFLAYLLLLSAAILSLISAGIYVDAAQKGVHRN